MKYGLIYADPPWQFATRSLAGRGCCPDFLLTRNKSRQNLPERHYKTLSLEDLKELPVVGMADKNCMLLMWAVDPMIPHALELGRCWGFDFKTVGFYWMKMRRESSLRGSIHEKPDHKMFPMGTGYWTRANPETCLLFTRGKPKRLSAGVRKLVVAPRREHSRKPDEIYARIEALVDGPYLEMFARQQRPGWSAWGNEVDKFSQVPDPFA